MNDVLLVLIVGSVNLLSFYLGAKLGGKENTESIKFPNLNPITKLEEHKEKKEEQKEEQKERERLDVIRQNIDNYNGTAEGQRDIPR